MNPILLAVLAVGLGLLAYPWRKIQRARGSRAWILMLFLALLFVVAEYGRFSLPARFQLELDVIGLTALVGLVITLLRVFREERYQLQESLAAEHKRARQMELLAALARHLSGLTDPQQLMDVSLAHVHRSLGFEHAILYLVEGDNLIPRAAHGFFARVAPDRLQLTMQQGVIGWAVRKGETCWVKDALSDERFVPTDGFQTRCEVAVPLRFAKNVIGVLNIESDQPGAFDATDVSALESLTDLVVLGLQASQLFDELRTRERLAEALRRVGVAVTASLNLGTVLDTICAETCRAFEAAAAVVWLLDDQGVELRVAAAHGLGAEAMLGQRRPAHDPSLLIARAVRERRPLWVNDLSRAAEYQPVFAHVPQVQALLVTPIMVEDKPLGALVILDVEHPQRFAAHHITAAKLLGAQLAVAIRNARLFDDVQRHGEEQRVLFLAARDFTAGLSEREVLQAVAQHMTGALRMAGCSLSVWEPENDRLVTLLHYHSDRSLGHDAPGTVYELGQYPATRQVLESRQPAVIRIDDAEADVAERAYLRSFGYAGLLMVPLVAGEQVFGLAELARREGAPSISEADVQLARSLAAQAGVALENARLHAEVQALALTDGLVGLFNRRAFDRALETEIVRAERYGQPLSLIILDLDSFKQYNDSYGHPAGDARLKAVAGLVRANMRDPDLAARYGGEEFAVLLPHTAKGGALALAERIRAAAEASAPALDTWGAVVPGYTLSLGVATFPDDAETAEALVVAADNAELAAKRQGKNRVVGAVPLPVVSP